jgi:sporulation protein YlmC with PRC-barrel domain
MLRIPKMFIPIVAAALVLTARTDETSSQASKSAANRQSSDSSAKEKNSELSQNERNQQSTFQPGQISESQLKKTVTEVNRASSFIGMNVKNMQNESLGKIHDLVFDPESGRISYAVISVGGVLGVGDKLIAIPVTSLKPQPGQKYLMLNMDKNQVQSAPGLAQNNWPDLDATGVGAPAGAESEKSIGAPESNSSSAQGASPSSATEKSPSGTPAKPSSTTQAQPARPDSSTSKSDSDQKQDQ